MPRIIYQSLSSVNEMRLTALITKPEWTHYRAALNLPLVVQAEPTTGGSAYLDYLAANLPSAVAVIYALGEGTMLDIGREVAHRSGKPLVLVPTMINDDRVLRAGEGDTVILDLEVISAAPSDQRGAGIVDVLSIVTALMDWGYAAQKNQLPPTQPFSAWGAGIAAGIVQQALKLAPGIGKGEVDSLKGLITLLALTATLDNHLGHRRASQGAEHLLADLLSKQPSSEGLPYAERLAAGILITSALHNRDVAPLKGALEAAGVRSSAVKKAEALAALLDAPSAVRTLNAPPTILNDLEANPEKLAETLAKSTLSI